MEDNASDKRLKEVLGATTMEEFAEARHNYFQPSKQEERLLETVDKVVSLVGTSISEGRDSIKLNGMIGITDIDEEHIELLFDLTKQKVELTWDIDSDWKNDFEKDEANVTWKKK